MCSSRSAKRWPRRRCPTLDRLEPRALLSGYAPTSIEQLYLEELDDARFDPAAFGDSLGLDLSSVAPAQPLAMSPLLVESARLHSEDMIAENYFSHTAPDGSGPEQRIQATGFPGTGWAESIEYNTKSALASQGFPANFAALDAEFSLSDLIVDQGTNPPGHRIMLLDIGGGFHAMRQVGIGLASQDTPDGDFTIRQTDTTIDMASTADSDPFLTGVVMSDMAGNGEYEPGDGLAGVTITVANVGSTTTQGAGGYSMQLAPGTYTVTASGGGLPAPVTRTVVLGNDNARLNFDENPNGATVAVSPGTEANVTLGSFTALEAGDTPASYSARIDWGNGTASYATLSPNTSGGFTVTGGASYALNGDYAVRVLITQLSSGQSIALNSTASVGGFANSGGGSGGSGQNPSNPAGAFFVARLNQAAKPKYYDVITLQNESGQMLDAKDVGRVKINNKSYKLHVTKWSSGEEAVIIFSTRQAAGQLFSFDFFGKRTSGLQSLTQSKQTKRFNPQLGYAFQITPSGSVIED